jgi:hypothetical protein
VTLIGPAGGHQHFGVTYFLPQDRTCSFESVTHLTTVHGATTHSRGLIIAPRAPKGVRRLRQLYQIDGFKDRVVCDFLAMREQKHPNLYNRLVTTKQTALKKTGEREVSHKHTHTPTHTHTHTHTPTHQYALYTIHTHQYALQVYTISAHLQRTQISHHQPHAKTEDFIAFRLHRKDSMSYFFITQL